MASRQREWQKRKQAEGKCTQCGQERGPDGNSQLCRKCVIKQRPKDNERKKRNYQKHKAKIREYQTVYQAERNKALRASGLCVKCGEPKSESRLSKVCCQKCSDAGKARYREKKLLKTS